jgi:hypothetical protein
VEGRRLRLVALLGVELVGFQRRPAESRRSGQCGALEAAAARLRKGDCGIESQLEGNPRLSRLFRRGCRATATGD